MSVGFSLGQIPVKGNYILAPLDGFSDQPFRWICRKFGSAVSYSEFINALDVPAGLNDLSKRTAFTEFERPVGFQLYGSNPAEIITAAEKLILKEPDFFDLNLGCSVRRIAGRGAGAGLLKNPKKIGTIISGLRKAVSLPITAKIRLGWDDDHMNYVTVSRILEGAGCAAIAVHARTRSDSYKSAARWDTIKEIKDSVSIPVIGNGDISSPADAEWMMSTTGCDAVMIGRAAIGNPWIFSGIDKRDLSREQILDICILHWQLTVSFFGVEKSRRIFKKHLKAYLATPQFSDLNLSELLSQPNPMRKVFLLSVKNVTSARGKINSCPSL